MANFPAKLRAIHVMVSLKSAEEENNPNEKEADESKGEVAKVPWIAEIYCQGR